MFANLLKEFANVYTMYEVKHAFTRHCRVIHNLAEGLDPWIRFCVLLEPHVHDVNMFLDLNKTSGSMVQRFLCVES